MSWFSKSQNNNQPTPEDAELLRDAVVGLLKQEADKNPGQRSRIKRLMERMEHFPVPTGLPRELELLLSKRAKVEIKKEKIVIPSLLPTEVGVALKNLARVADAVSLIDNQIKINLNACLRLIPLHVELSDLEKISSQSQNLISLGKAARQKEIEMRDEVARLISTMMVEITRASTIGQNMEEELSNIAIKLGSINDVVGFRELRQELTSQVRTLANTSKELGSELSYMKRKTKALEDMVAQQQEEILDLTSMINIDPLTEVSNRRAFDKHIELSIRRAKATTSPLSIAILDIDHFKIVNDSFGHQFGDLVLKDLAKTLTAGCRNDDLVSRYGGEEFVITLRGANTKVARNVLDRLLEDVRNLKFDNGHKITISAGLATFDGEESSGKLISRADSALYIAKNNGRNQLVISEQSKAVG